MIYQLIFAVIATIVVISAFFAVFSRSIVRAAFSLFFTLLGMAGLFFLLGADFLAVTQIVIYVGGIMILLVFGISLTHRSLARLKIDSMSNYLVGGAIGLGLFTLLFVLIHFSFSGTSPSELAVPEPTTAPIGQLLLTNYLLPFEFASITLLMALIAAAYLVRRKDPK
jgi:NADH:ubiquinone oxidoreductase subunit 6 (subunit J)